MLPAAIDPAIREHVERHTSSDPAALVFTGAKGGVLRRGNFRRASRRADAVAAIGAPGLHSHDLRPTGNTLAAQSGHDSVRAAMIYQHATSEAGRAIATH